MQFAPPPAARDYDAVVGRRVRRYRQDRTLAQRAVSEMVYPGRPSMWLSRVELGQRPLNAYEAVELARILDVKVRRLLRPVKLRKPAVEILPPNGDASCPTSKP